VLQFLEIVLGATTDEYFLLKLGQSDRDGSRLFGALYQREEVLVFDTILA
jgi:hypothetical protein